MIKSKEFYYTKESMVKDLLKLLSLQDCSVLDAGSGLNKVWYNNLNCKKKFECEIENGCEFYRWDIKVDWIIGNPPHRNKKGGENQIWKWIQKSSEIARNGMAFLLNHKVFNTLTPKRLEELKQKEFYLSKIYIVQDKRWFGRYYFLIFKKKINNFIGWELKSY